MNVLAFNKRINIHHIVMVSKIYCIYVNAIFNCLSSYHTLSFCTSCNFKCRIYLTTFLQFEGFWLNTWKFFRAPLLFLLLFKCVKAEVNVWRRVQTFPHKCKTSTGFMSGSVAQTIIIISTILSKKRKEAHITRSWLSIHRRLAATLWNQWIFRHRPL